MHDRWLRFHSLPESKRYAGTEGEYAELLMRANTVATEVLGEGDVCWLVQSIWDESGAVRVDTVTLGSHQLTQSFLWREYEDTEDFDVDWMAYATQTVWKAGAFDSVIRRIADDELRAVIWVSPDNGAVFAPYDGGMDLILPSPEAVLELKSRHRGWLSRHPGGL